MSDDTRNSEAPTVQEENEETEIDEMDAMKPEETPHKVSSDDE